jgi:RHS repeat-associated protein
VTRLLTFILGLLAMSSFAYAPAPKPDNSPVAGQQFDYGFDVYDGWNLIAVLDGDLHVKQSFLWGPDLSGTMQGAGGVGGLLAVTDATQGTHFVAYDDNGNVVALVNATDGTVSARYEYGPFGEPISAAGPMAKVNPFRFSTKYHDNETELVYYGFRYYDPSMGRWLSKDPLGVAGGANLYGFVGNDPIGAIDPYGDKSCNPLSWNWSWSYNWMPNSMVRCLNGGGSGSTRPNEFLDPNCTKH